MATRTRITASHAQVSDRYEASDRRTLRTQDRSRCGLELAPFLRRLSLPLLKRIATAVVLIPIVLALVLRAPVPVLAVVARRWRW